MALKKSLFKVAAWCKAVATLLFLTISGFSTLPIMAATFPIWFISKSGFRVVNREILKLYYSCLAFIIERWAHIEVIIYGDHLEYGETAIALLNHRSSWDWMLSFAVVARIGIHGTLKVIMKDSLKWVPVFGWMQWFTENVFIKRDWETDSKNLYKSLNIMKEFPRPLWFCIFPEGTRLTKASLQKSQDWCKKINMPVLQHVLIPRTKAFVATVSRLRGSFSTLLDATMVVEKEPKFFEIFAGSVNTRCHVHFKKFKTSDLPTSDEGLDKWVTDRYIEKDRFIDDFFKNGNKFPDHNKRSVSYPSHLFVVGYLLYLAAVTYYFPRSILPSAMTCVYIVVGLGVILAATVAGNLKQGPKRKPSSSRPSPTTSKKD